MTISEQIQKDMVDAMRSRDELRLSTLRMVKSALSYKEVEKRAPLDDKEKARLRKQALDWLRDWVIPRFEALGKKLLSDPWEARNAYIHVVLDRHPEFRERFGKEQFARELIEEEQVIVWKLMELQRQ